MTREELDRLAELLAKATPGPWKITRATRGDYTVIRGDDVRLAIALVNAAPALLAAVREADELRAWQGDAVGWLLELRTARMGAMEIAPAIDRLLARVKS